MYDCKIGIPYGNSIPQLLNTQTKTIEAIKI